MSDPVDPLLKARAAALAELRRTPIVTSWRRQAAWLALCLVGLCLLAGATMLGARTVTPAELAPRALGLGALLGLAGLAGVATLAPRPSGWTIAVLTLGPATMAGLVLARGAGAPSMTPAWVCSVSHLAVGLIPLGAALVALRQSAWSWPRALAAGFGAGTVGAFLGELACHRGPGHVLIHHIGAWLLITLACVAIACRSRPRSFAP